MRVVHTLDSIGALPDEICVTIGNFDGVHAGHQALLQRLVDEAKSREGAAVAVTFEPHPVSVFRGPEHPSFRLTTPAQRQRHMERAGVDLLLILPFDRELSALAPMDFVRSILVEGLRASYVLVGYDFNFGKARTGNAAELERAGALFGFDAVSFGPVAFDGEPISSSRVRTCVRHGQVEDAALLMGRPFALAGRIVNGDARGREIGIPTANLGPTQQVNPAAGVYVTTLMTQSGARWPAVTNVGVLPTFQNDGREVRCETHALDAPRDLNLYGQDVEIDFHARIRDEVRFKSADELVTQIHDDIAYARAAHLDADWS